MRQREVCSNGIEPTCEGWLGLRKTYRNWLLYRAPLDHLTSNCGTAVTIRTMYCGFVVLRHLRREIVRIAVTKHPTAE